MQLYPDKKQGRIDILGLDLSHRKIYVNDEVNLSATLSTDYSVRVRLRYEENEGLMSEAFTSLESNFVCTTEDIEAIPGLTIVTNVSSTPYGMLYAIQIDTGVYFMQSSAFEANFKEVPRVLENWRIE